VSQALAERVRQLAERYASPMPTLVDEVTVLASRVEAHLKKMGATWN
jgi:type I restriction enzyme M protein